MLSWPGHAASQSATGVSVCVSPSKQFLSLSLVPPPQVTVQPDLFSQVVHSCKFLKKECNFPIFTSHLQFTYIFLTNQEGMLQDHRSHSAAGLDLGCRFVCPHVAGTDMSDSGSVDPMLRHRSRCTLPSWTKSPMYHPLIQIIDSHIWLKSRKSDWPFPCSPGHGVPWLHVSFRVLSWPSHSASQSDTGASACVSPSKHFLSPSLVPPPQVTVQSDQVSQVAHSSNIKYLKRNVAYLAQN